MSPYLINLALLTLLASFCHATYMAVGPPIAPLARFMNSSQTIDSLLRDWEQHQAPYYNHTRPAPRNKSFTRASISSTQQRFNTSTGTSQWKSKIVDLNATADASNVRPQFGMSTNVSNWTLNTSDWRSANVSNWRNGTHHWRNVTRYPISPVWLNTSNDQIQRIVKGNFTASMSVEASTDLTAISRGDDMDYWFLSDTKFNHRQPFAGSSDYLTFRNVRDFGAQGDGITDDWFAIMTAIKIGGRCGQDCPATSTKGALIYFPPGRYLIKKPIVQYYYTSFVGHPTQRPVIVGSKDFQGMALIDTDVYIEGGYGAEWWVNQNNFYRQIRNFELDMTQMPNWIPKGAVEQWPVGIHWQVSQACTLQNIHFLMPIGLGITNPRHRGIFMENGSGGFVSDLEFTGGNTGFVAGNQQYTMRNLRFKYCETAIEVIWNWGFTMKDINVQECKTAINATAVGGTLGAPVSTGSISVLDSYFRDVEDVVLLAEYEGHQATLVLDNLNLEGAIGAIVSVDKRIVLSGGPSRIASWALGRRYTPTDIVGNVYSGDMTPPFKDASLLTSDGRFFSREKPQYEGHPPWDFLNVLDFDVKNDGTYPNSNWVGINMALAEAANTGKILVFPAGIYKVDDTLMIPKGSRIVGALWSQIMAVGDKFQDQFQPHVLARVGEPGDRGTIEISDMMFTGSGPTAGAVFIEWNIKEELQGSAAMWDSIVRVGGAVGTYLQSPNCHQYGVLDIPNCIAGQMMLHLTKTSSAYLENIWLWVADHDIDSAAQTRINVYVGRGALIESQGPVWIHSASNEHSTLYNWQLAGARNIYLAHIQSETPYFQAGQLDSRYPYPPDYDFVSDPEFADCEAQYNDATWWDPCREAWALRIIGSENVYLYGGGFYSFFQRYQDTCAKSAKTCQDKLIDTDYSQYIWLYNLFTVGANEVISP